MIYLTRQVKSTHIAPSTRHSKASQGITRQNMALKGTRYYTTTIAVILPSLYNR